MNKTQIRAIAGAGAILLLLVGLGALGVTDSFSILALPFTLLSKFLRFLSISGKFGNIVAIILYLIVGLLPLLFLKKRKWKIEDILLPMCSLSILYTLYYLINPALKPMILAGDIGNEILSEAIYSILITWIVIKLIRQSTNTDTSQVYQALRVFLLLCSMLYFIAIIVSFGDFLAAVKSIQTANTMDELNLFPTYIFVFLNFGITAVECALDAFIIILATKLIQEIQKEPYSVACHLASNRISIWCRRALVIISLSNTILIIGQILFASFLHNINIQLHIPITSIVMVFALLALTTLLGQGKQLKEDNDLFI